MNSSIPVSPFILPVYSSPEGLTPKALQRVSNFKICPPPEVSARVAGLCGLISCVAASSVVQHACVRGLSGSGITYLLAQLGTVTMAPLVAGFAAGLFSVSLLGHYDESLQDDYRHAHGEWKQQIDWLHAPSTRDMRMMGRFYKDKLIPLEEMNHRQHLELLKEIGAKRLSNIRLRRAERLGNLGVEARAGREKLKKLATLLFSSEGGEPTRMDVDRLASEELQEILTRDRDGLPLIMAQLPKKELETGEVAARIDQLMKQFFPNKTIGELLEEGEDWVTRIPQVLFSGDNADTIKIDGDSFQVDPKALGRAWIFRDGKIDCLDFSTSDKKLYGATADVWKLYIALLHGHSPDVLPRKQSTEELPQSMQLTCRVMTDAGKVWCDSERYKVVDGKRVEIEVENVQAFIEVAIGRAIRVATVEELDAVMELAKDQQLLHFAEEAGKHYQTFRIVLDHYDHFAGIDDEMMQTVVRKAADYFCDQAVSSGDSLTVRQAWEMTQREGCRTLEPLLLKKIAQSVEHQIHHWVDHRLSRCISRCWPGLGEIPEQIDHLLKKIAQSVEHQIDHRLARCISLYYPGLGKMLERFDQLMLDIMLDI